MQERIKKLLVLCVEDNPADARLIRELFKESQISCDLTFVRDGSQALDYLFHHGDFATSPVPDLILLDLNLPGLDGREVLRAIKNHAHLRLIPVLVLTSSDSDEDVRRCYELHANSYITKPAELDAFSAVVESIEQFWLSTAVLPRVDHAGAIA